MIGKTTTTTPLWHTPDTPCIKRSMMKIMRRNELQRTEPFLMRKKHSYIIHLGKGMDHRSTQPAHHRSTINLNNNVGSEHRPILLTTNRLILKPTMFEKEITRLGVGQMITITKAMQWKQNFRHTQKQTHFIQRPVGEELGLAA